MRRVVLRAIDDLVLRAAPVAVALQDKLPATNRCHMGGAAGGCVQEALRSITLTSFPILSDLPHVQRCYSSTSRASPSLTRGLGSWVPQALRRSPSI